MESALVIASRVGPVGRLTLNRPESLNALDLPMIRAVRRHLDKWRGVVGAVVVDGVGDRGFCAGGDIKVVHDSLLHDHGIVEELWREEYALDYTVATYPHPVVTVMHGITMGGGMGLGAHASHRVVTASSRLAMPEVRIGMAPDVAGTLLLGRMSGRLGEHFALTAAEARGADAVHLGLADVLVEESRLGEVVERVAADGPDAMSASLAVELPPCTWDSARPWIDDAYAAPRLPDVLARLASRPEDAAREAVAALAALPPRALAVSLAAVRRARAADDVAAVLRQDLRVMLRFLDSTDPAEGIRARVIDRTRPPTWSPANPSDVPDSLVDRHFQPLEHELELPSAR
ncbi:MAG: enoyl-CoA hydratase/isomerase family protein [Tetrasphaera sp.]